jgi:hypothetical protein
MKTLNKLRGLTKPKRFAKRIQYFYFSPDLSKYLDRNETLLRQRLVEKNLAKTGYKKVFCIGANKTGTTTLEAVLHDLGFKMPDQRMQESLLSHVLSSGRYDVLRKFVARYDAFQDVPFSSEELYVALDALFPNSKFVLTLRDPSDWHSSLVRFHKKVFGFENIEETGPEFWEGIRGNYFFEEHKRLVTRVINGRETVDWKLMYDRDYCISNYTQRNDRIIRYFRQRPKDLLTIDITKTVDTAEICAFLEFGAEKVQQVPHLNAT